MATSKPSHVKLMFNGMLVTIESANGAAPAKRAYRKRTTPGEAKRPVGRPRKPVPEAA